MIKVSYATMEAMGMLVKRLGQDARRLEKALAETMNASAEWKRIAEEMKKERNALRAATIDTAAGSLLDAFGSLANEPRNGSPDDKYHVRIVTKIHAIKLDRDALRKERDALRAQLDTERKPKPVDVPRAHPVAVGEWVERTSNEYDPNTKIGAVAQVVSIDADGDYQVAINGVEVCWSAEYCTPCDPPTASHITPAGKETAQAAAEPKPGDTVRLVKVPTCNDYGHAWILEWGAVGNMGKVCKIRSYPFGNVAVVDIDARLSYEWPLSCVEVVKGGDK